MKTLSGEWQKAISGESIADTEEIADIKLFSLEEVIKLNNAHSRVRQYTKYSLHKDFYRIGSEIKWITN